MSYDSTKVKSWLKNLPNKLTVARILAIPLIILLYPLDFNLTRWICAILFMTAAITDFFDGYLARKYDSVTTEGALLDPIADKMLVIAGLILLVGTHQLYSIVAILFICRDVAVNGMRMIALEKNVTIEVNKIGKYKTAAQILAIFFLMIGAIPSAAHFRMPGMLIIWLALGLSLWSGYTYWQDFWKKINSVN